ncbi:MAG: hypothetical protein KJ666_18395 [Bacteroidetes bacterium]|nr:hypothetical protein [Bacteroidota bacterium]
MPNAKTANPDLPARLLLVSLPARLNLQRQAGQVNRRACRGQPKTRMPIDNNIEFILEIFIY